MKYFLSLLLCCSLTVAADDAQRDDYIQAEYYGSELLPDTTAFSSFVDLFDYHWLESPEKGAGFLSQKVPGISEDRIQKMAARLAKISRQMTHKSRVEQRKILCPDWRNARHEEDIYNALNGLDGVDQRIHRVGFERFVKKLTAQERAEFTSALNRLKKNIDHVSYDVRMEFELDPQRNVRSEVDAMCDKLEEGVDEGVES